MEPKPKKFKKGDRVFLNTEWRKCAGEWHSFHHGDTATVIGPSRTAECYRLVFDGQVTRHTFHNSFLSRRRK